MIPTSGFIRFTLFSALVTSCLAATCNVGTDDPSSHTSTLEDPRQTDTAFFLQGRPSPCCGKLLNWAYHITNATFIGETIEAQLWRSTGGSNYQLIAQESITVPAVGVNSQNAAVPEALVKIGDIIGWEVNAEEIIAYDTTGGYDVQMNTIGVVPINNSIAWGQTPVSRSYAFGAVVTQNEVPVVNDATVTYSDTSLPVTFSTVSVSDAETLVADLNIVLQTNTYFQLDGLDIKEISPGTVPAGVYTLTVTAEDNCDIATGTTTITITGTAPTLNVPYTHATTYSDDFTSATDTYLFNVVVTDTDPDKCAIISDPAKVTIDNASPPTYGVSLLAGADLDYDDAPVGQVLVVVNCTDLSGLSVTGTYTVLLSDASPVISGGPLTTTIDNETPGGTALPGTFTCTDSDDTLTVAINPANAEFTIDSSAAPSYTVEVVGPLTVNTHTLTIECTENDGTPTSVTDTYTVTVTNKPPVVSNGTGTTSDGLDPAESLLGTFTCTDGVDTCSCSVSDLVKFEVKGTHPNFEVWRRAAQTLTPGTIDLTLPCTDGTTSVDGYFTVTVGNTAPVWDKAPGNSDYSLPDNTTTAPGTPLGTFSLRDPDTCTCTITSPAAGTHPYVLNQITTVDPQEWSVTTIASPAEDDIDFNDGSTVALTIECDDGSNPPLTGTFTVTLEDSPPVVSGLPGSKTVNEGIQVAEEYIAFTCTDGDDGCTCTLTDPATPATPRFEIRTSPLALWSVNGAVLSLAESVITLDITCTDGTTPITQQFDVTVANLPPVITNLDANHSTPYYDNFTSATDEFIYTIIVTDPSPDACTPNHTDFTIVNSAPGSYDLYLVAGANPNYDVAPQLVVGVTCTDTAGGSSSGVYIVPIEDAPPVLSGLPGTPYDSLSDATVNATPLTGTEFNCTDSDDVCMCNVDPAATVENSIFEVLAGGSTGEFLLGVKASPGLDASITSNYTVPIVCTDGNSVVNDTKVILIANEPPVFATLDATGSVNVTVLESETAARELYRECVNDTTKLYCYRTSTTAAPPIKLKVEHGSPPCTAELIISLQDDPRLDYESGPGVMYLSLTCEDKESAVTRMLTVLIGNMAPNITNPGGSITLKETLDPSQEVKLKDIKLDRYDWDSDCRVSNNDGGAFFQIVKEKKYNVLKKMPDPSPLDFEAKSEYNLVIECEDKAGNITTDTFTVYVENVGPYITNTERRILVPESENSPNDVLYLALNTSEFANNCYQTSSETHFKLKLIPGTSQWGVYYTGGSKLDYDTKRKYPLTGQCDDGAGLAGEVKKIDVIILKNEDPTFTNLNDFTSVDAKTTPSDTDVYEVLTSDPENDPVNITLLGCDCPNCPFELVAGSGKVITTQDLATYTDAFHCTLTFQINDPYNTPKPKKLVIEIKDANHVPEITFLPQKIGTWENRPIGESIYKITRDYNFIDDDATDIPKFECRWPDGGDAVFECDENTGDIKVKDEIDFETQKASYDVEIIVKDDWNNSVSKTMEIVVFDKIEPLKFTQKVYEIVHDEGKAGDLLGCPAWQIKDDEVWDRYIYSMECPGAPDGIVMNHATGCVYQTKEIDLDASIRQAILEFECTVTAEEAGAELDALFDSKFKDTATIKFKIEDKDDNAPHFTQRQYAFCAPATSSAPVRAYDNDVAAENKDLTFTLTGGSPVGFTTNADGTSGEITVGDVSGYPVGTLFKRTLMVTDKQGNSDSIPVDVVVCEVPPVPPVVVPPSSNNNAGTTSTNDMLYWVIPAGLLLALMAGLLIFLCWRCWRNGGCGRACGGGARPKHPKVTRVQETPPRRAQTPPKRSRTPPRTPTPPKQQPGKLPEVEMAMTNFWARNTTHAAQVTN